MPQTRLGDVIWFKRGIVGVYPERHDRLLATMKASALPIGELVKPVTPKQKARRLLHLRKKK
ncbi:hypothetical protein X767_13665 [Mesorhizobium sp. LSJC264A00]|nr:hypothetical protein X767_13665 [Mesorhizobium sp. LSJC264A00]